VPNARSPARGPCGSAAVSRRIHVDVMDGHLGANRTIGRGPGAAFAPLVMAPGGMAECRLIGEDQDRYPNM
jgi:pentose-5-phosphate-3-epimerase